METHEVTTVVLKTSHMVEKLNNSNVFLFIPLDNNRDIVHPKLATMLECWYYDPAAPRQDLPYFTEQSVAGGMSMALVRQGVDEVFGSFHANILNIPGTDVRDWAMHLHRAYDKDIITFNLEVVE